MAKVSDFIIERLHQWGIKRLFGYPGDAINPLMAAIDRANNESETIDYVQATHEEMCAFMACAHAKFTGEIGVCLATSGPGAIHLLNGLYDAKMDNQPVLAIVGQQQRNALGTSFLQDVDLAALFKDVAHEYVNVATSPEQVRHLLDRSIRTAYAEKSVTCLILPHDIQNMKSEAEPKREHGQSFSGVGFSTPYIVPKDTDLRWAADILNAGKKVAILVGAGALNARDEIVEIADLLQAGVAKALLGKAAVEDSLPFVTGSIGMLGTKASEEMMRNCDTFFMVGSNFPYAEFLPKPGSAKGIQIDINAQNISLRYPMDVGLIGDTKATLRQLIPLIERKEDNSWREQVLGYVSESTKSLYEQAHSEGEPLNPQQVFFDLNKFLPENCIITADSGTSTVWYARHLKMRPGMMGSVSGGLASMGCSLPYAIAAKFAYPDRSVIACTGDGAMQMIGNNELITISKYWRKWSNPQLVILVLKNNDLSFVTWEQRAHEGDPKFAPSQDLLDFPYAKYAQSLGLEGYLIESASQIDSVLKYAMSATRPALIEVLADANIPPVPPNAGMKEAVNLVEAVSKEDEAPHKPVWRSIAQALGNMFR